MSRTKSRALQLLVGAALVAAVSPALALNSYSKSWQAQYPGSSSDNADCALCHGSSTGNLNAYGRDLCLAFGASVPADITPLLLGLEGLDSDGAGATNLEEIGANAQPGWTTGSNAIYALSDGGCAALGTSIGVPAGVPLPYDPPSSGDPVAVPGGPYSGHVNVPVSFDGSASFDSDGGGIASYAWDFGDGTTGAGAVTAHAYAVASSYVVTLTVLDDEGMSSTNSTSATISAASVLDLDIAGLKVTSSVQVGRTISIQLSVDNPGTVVGQAIATVVGARDGVEVYRWRLNVFDYPGKGTTSFDFPAHTPGVEGTIVWTAFIADVDPDVDTATAGTLVK